MKPELTPPQSMLLMKICERPCYVSDYYPPAGRLIKRGYAEFRGNILHPTEAGKALAKAPPDESLAAFDQWWKHGEPKTFTPHVIAKSAWNAALAWHKNKTKE